MNNTIFPNFEPNSLVKSCLTEEVWNLCRNHRCDKFAFPFIQAIAPGLKHQNSSNRIGVYAGSHDSYYSFAPLFD